MRPVSHARRLRERARRVRRGANRVGSRARPVPSIPTSPTALVERAAYAAIAVHGLVYRTSGGLVGHRVPFLPPMLLLDHVGARSGVRRTTPLVYVRDGEDMVIVA